MFLRRTSGGRACPHALPLLPAVRSTQTYLTWCLTFNAFLRKNLPAPANQRHARFRPFGRWGGQARTWAASPSGHAGRIHGGPHQKPASGSVMNLKEDARAQSGRCPCLARGRLLHNILLKYCVVKGTKVSGYWAAGNKKVREPSSPRTFEAWISSEICQCPSGKRLSRLLAFNARAS